MIRRLREARIIPIMLIAAGCLFALKAAGLWLDGGYTLGQRLSRGETLTVTTVPASSTTPLRSQTTPLDVAGARPAGQRSWAQEMFGYPEITGSVDAPRPGGHDREPAKDAKPTPKAEAPQTRPAAAAEKPVDLAARPEPARQGSSHQISAAERAILERLVERRQELEARARELELRENLLKAAEKNLEAKLATQKAKEEAGGGERRSEAEAARFKSLVTMYETMKPKEAAKIFDRLEMKVLAEVASRINPRRMSEILAQMAPETAERLTVEFASRGAADRPQKPAELPKIDGRPVGG